MGAESDWNVNLLLLVVSEQQPGIAFLSRKGWVKRAQSTLAGARAGAKLGSRDSGLGCSGQNILRGTPGWHVET